jgi:hypothetical protein
MNAEIHISQEEDDYEDYTVCFFINPSDILPSDVPKTEGHKYIFIFFDDVTQAQTYGSYAKDMHYENLKVIFIESSPQYFEKDIDSLLWFSFSRTKDVFLHIYHPPAYTIEQKPKKTKKKVSFSLSFLGKPKYLIPIGFLFILLTHLLFIPPLFEATMEHYQSVKELDSGSLNQIPARLTSAKKSLELAESLYKFPKATFNLFSLGLYVEDIFHINNSANKALSMIVRLQENAQQVTAYMTVPDKSPKEIEDLYKRKAQIFEDIRTLDNEISYLKEKIPDKSDFHMIKVKLEEGHTWLTLASTLEEELDLFFGRYAEKKYLVLFANNMELRPGGGFIGSFAIIKLKDYAIKDLKVYDVYDADGQLTEQIDPPDPIVKYLNQTHWYLRDSAFSPDFTDNFLDAETFAEKELGERDFDGGMRTKRRRM